MSINLIPQPQSLEILNGVFVLSSESKIAYSGSNSEQIADLLANYLKPATGFSLPIVEGESAEITLKAIDQGVEDDAGFVDESYKLEITDKGVAIEANNATGLARGIQTLRQLFSSAIFHQNVQTIEWELPCVLIKDKPRFRWRGQHLDVCRHFFSVEDVCRFIDLLALHRLNICHLHLTEDQGWRIEIKKYPKLTKIGSRRECTLIGHESKRPREYDNEPYEGFYTQEELKKIVKFAEERHITIVPEIDMPGHMVAAISAYPELGNTDVSTNVKPRCHWGISQQVLNVDQNTIDFMKDILSEVIDIFPSRFIHIGGDEAPKHEWNESKRAQNRMRDLGLKNEKELQSWFLKQMDEFISSKGRRLIGWDEILEGGIAKGAAVMSWRGEKGGIDAANLNHNVVMSIRQFYYFDNYQIEPKDNEPLAIGGLITTEKVYEYNPIPDELKNKKEALVMGGQGQLWTEYIENIKHLEYMGFPRICALAEGLWLDLDKKNLKEFLLRLKFHRERLKFLNVNAHPLP
jgi:hexosaminidase